MVRKKEKTGGIKISSRKVSVFLVIAASLIGVLPNWPGTAIVTVTALTEINFTAGAVDWGAGRVDSGSASATLDSDAGTVTGGTWTPNSG